MKLEATSPVQGVATGSTFTVDTNRGNWLLTNGYARKPGGNPDDFNGLLATTVDADADPTLARNRNDDDSNSDEAVGNRGRGGTPSTVAKSRRSA